MFQHVPKGGTMGSSTPMDPINEIKNRISIEDLVAQYVPLKKAGRQFKALCPFHKERTPSFYVSPERQIAYCFGCHKGGDQFKFIQEMEGLDFRGALEYLAERAGVVLPKQRPEARVQATERERLIEVHEAATVFFETQFSETEEGEKVSQYLKKRGLKEETIRAARVGYAPAGGNALYKFLLEKNFSRSEIVAAGLVFARDTEQGECTDRFRQRLIFPIHNLAGQVCAFGGRALKEGDEPKYLNSPETPVYHKSNLLYGLASARAEIRRLGFAVLVEGYMDALACRQAGFTNTVACSGTALTQDQFATLKRFTKEVVFSFDRDTAGRLATERAIELGFAQELAMKVAVWDGDAKDPDECLRESPEHFAKALEKAPAASDYLLQTFRENFDTAQAEGKRKFLEAVLPFVNRLKSPLEIEDWLKKVSAFTGSSLQVLYDELKRFQGKQSRFPTRERVDARPGPEERKFSTEEYLLGILLTHTELLGKISRLVILQDFEENALQNIYRSLGSQYNLTLEEQERANILSMYVENRLAEAPWEVVEKEAIETVRSLKKKRIEQEKRTLKDRMKEATAPEKSEMLDEFQKLLREGEKFI